jgi:predicted ATPase
MVEQLCGNGARTLEFAERARAIAAEHGLSFWMAGGAVLSGWAVAAEGDRMAGLSLLRQGVNDWRATGSVTYETYFLGLLAECLIEVGRFDEALAVLEESLALVERTDERLYEPELYRLRGAVLLARVNAESSEGLAGAEANFRRAHALGKKRLMRSLELRAAISLAELGARIGAPGDGRKLLSAAYSAFSDGFETSDLKRAAALLSKPSAE